MIDAAGRIHPDRVLGWAGIDHGGPGHHPPAPGAVLRRHHQIAVVFQPFTAVGIVKANLAEHRGRRGHNLIPLRGRQVGRQILSHRTAQRFRRAAQAIVIKLQIGPQPIGALAHHHGGVRPDQAALFAHPLEPPGLAERADKTSQEQGVGGPDQQIGADHPPADNSTPARQHIFPRRRRWPRHPLGIVAHRRVANAERVENPRNLFAAPQGKCLIGGGDQHLSHHSRRITQRCGHRSGIVGPTVNRPASRAGHQVFAPGRQRPGAREIVAGGGLRKIAGGIGAGAITLAARPIHQSAR